MASSVGIRALQQNASAVVSRVESGESIEITDRGRPVARLVPILSTSPIEALRAAGRVREASRPLQLTSRPPKRPKGKPTLSSVLADMRADER
jgi:prevent-host-death family protein